MRHFALMAVAAVSLAASSALGGEPAAQPKTSPDGAKPVLKAVVHVNFADAERQKHGLKNVTNILKEVKGAAEIVVVCHGGGIGLLVKGQSQHAADVEKLLKGGVRFVACENTLRDKSIPKESLLPGVTTVPAGAVEVLRKQQEGYGYFKP